MAMMMPSGGGRRGKRGKPLMTEINVTPMVDVMLVLLVVFMVTAPLLVTGEPVDLAKTKSKPLPPSKGQSLAVRGENKHIQRSINIAKPIAAHISMEYNPICNATRLGNGHRRLVRGARDMQFPNYIALAQFAKHVEQ